MKNNWLIVVDMQNDFVNGSLGTPEAERIVPAVVDKIKNWQGNIIVTRDVHYDHYLNTFEGQNLPVRHCIFGTPGVELQSDVFSALGDAYDNGCRVYFLTKHTFGSMDLANFWKERPEPDEIELVGLCTDVCVVSNALLLRAALPETPIKVDSACCAGTNPDKHWAALRTMESCQIEVKY